MATDTKEKSRRETPTMEVAEVKIQRAGERLELTDHDTLRNYLTWARKQINEDDGTRWTWDDVAFDFRTKTGKRIVRESVRQWADRYGLLAAKSDQDGEDSAEA